MCPAVGAVGVLVNHLQANTNAAVTIVTSSKRRLRRGTRVRGHDIKVQRQDGKDADMSVKYVVVAPSAA
jgi:hypothetical protein